MGDFTIRETQHAHPVWQLFQIHLISTRICQISALAPRMQGATVRYGLRLNASKHLNCTPALQRITGKTNQVMQKQLGQSRCLCRSALRRGNRATVKNNKPLIFSKTASNGNAQRRCRTMQNNKGRLYTQSHQ